MRILRISIFLVLVFVAVFSTFFLSVAGLFFFLKLPVDLFAKITMAFGGLASFMAVFSMVAVMKCNGVFAGICFGFILSSIVLILTYCFSNNFFSIFNLLKILVIVSLSVLGGVLGNKLSK